MLRIIERRIGARIERRIVHSIVGISSSYWNEHIIERRIGQMNSSIIERRIGVSECSKAQRVISRSLHYHRTYFSGITCLPYRITGISCLPYRIERYGISRRCLHYHRTSISMYHRIDCYSRGYCTLHDSPSLEKILIDIDLVYRHLPERFSFSEDKLIEIKELISRGDYKFSPLRVYLLHKDNYPKDRFLHIFTIVGLDLDLNYCMGVIPSEEDYLVLTSLGRSINNAILDKNLLLDNSFGMKTRVKNYYSNLISRGKIGRDGLFRMDLTLSLQSINKSYLMDRLKSIISNKTLLELVQSYLSMSYYIYDSSNKENITVDLPNISIPPIGLISLVLLNLALTDLDHEFKRNYPHIVYSRYIHEVYISNSSLSERSLSLLLDKLSYSGKIFSIKPGESSKSCYVGKISINQSGKIKVEYKNI